jgi:hypothetical protein
MSKNCSQSALSINGNRYYLADFDAHAYDPETDTVQQLTSQTAARRLDPDTLLAPKGTPVDPTILLEAGRARGGRGRPLRETEKEHLEATGAIVEGGGTIGGGAARTQRRRQVLEANLHTLKVDKSGTLRLGEDARRAKLQQVMEAPLVDVYNNGVKGAGGVRYGPWDSVATHTGTNTVAFSGEHGVSRAAAHVFAVVRNPDGHSCVVAPSEPATREPPVETYLAAVDVVGPPTGRDSVKDTARGIVLASSTAAGSVAASVVRVAIPILTAGYGAAAAPAVGFAAKKADDKLQRTLDPHRFSDRPKRVTYTVADGVTLDGAAVTFQHSVRDLDPFNDPDPVYAKNKAVVRSALREAANDRIRQLPKDQQPALKDKLDAALHELDSNLEEFRYAAHRVEHDSRLIPELNAANELWNVELRGTLLTPDGPAQWVENTLLRR